MGKTLAKLAKSNEFAKVLLSFKKYYKKCKSVSGISCVTNVSFVWEFSSIHCSLLYVYLYIRTYIYVMPSHHIFNWKCKCHWSSSHVHTVITEMSNCGSITMVFAKMRWGFLNSPKFYHRQYSKSVYSPMFSLPKSKISQFAKVLPHQSFALYAAQHKPFYF